MHEQIDTQIKAAKYSYLNMAFQLDKINRENPSCTLTLKADI